MLCSSDADRQTDTKVNTEDTFLGFQEFFLQPIIKDRSNLSQQITAGAGGTHIQTDRQTDTKVNTEDTLSGFQKFFLQPIIKDRSNIYKKWAVGHP